MRSSRNLVLFGALVTLSASALAAPLSEGGSAPGLRVGPAERGLPVVPASRPEVQPSVADIDRNGLSDGLDALLATAAPEARLDVVVTFSGRSNAAAAQQAVGAFDLHNEFSLISGFAATMTAGQAQALARSPSVFRVEQDLTVYANLEAARRDFGIERLATETATAAVTGAGIGICVVDTGVHPTHEEFTDEVGVSKVVAFKDLIGDANGVFHEMAYDDHGHGTHVTNIAAGDGTGLSLAAPLRGVAPGATVYSAKVLNFNGEGADSIVVLGIEWCASQPDVHVINLSLGNTGSSDGLDALSQAANAAAASGIVVVVAAGNSGAGTSTISSPAAAAGAITVGAAAEWSASTADPWFSAGLYPAPFSSRGPTADGRIKPDIMAPGVTIASAYADPLNIWGCGDGCYAVLSGSSMASPFVAGTVALMLEAGGPALTSDQVRQILANTAQDRGAVAGKDNDWGFGLADPYAAVAQAMSLTDIVPTAFPTHESGRDSVAKNGATRIPIDVPVAGVPLAVTVTIDGGLSAFGWGPDLDALLLDADGNPFLVSNPLYPWFSSEPFIPAAGTSSTCPAGEECGLVGRQETMHLNAPVAGRYYLEVYPFDGWPNNGAGGPFSYDISNGTTGLSDPAPVPALLADAGADQTALDTDGDGFETIFLDGSASTGDITSYVWSLDGFTIPDGMTSTVTLPLGSYTITLTASDGTATSSDVVEVTVKKKRGKPCNPRKEVCTQS